MMMMTMMMTMMMSTKIFEGTNRLALTKTSGYLKAKAEDEGWDPSSTATWKKEVVDQPVQRDEKSCGIFVAMVT